MAGQGETDSGGRSPFRERASRLSLALLYRRMRLWRIDSDVAAVVDVLCRSRDERTWAVAGRALDRLWTDPRFSDRVRRALRGTTEPWHRPESARRDLPPGITAFLTGAAPDTAHEPRVRLTAHLDEAPETELSELAAWVVEAFPATTDPRARQDLFGLLTATDHPILLGRLERALGSALANARRRLAPDHRHSPQLWVDGQPAPLMDVLQANPHLPQDRGVSRLRDDERAVLAVLMGRFDLAEPDGADDEAAVRAVLAALDLPVPTFITVRCRRLLRELAPGPGRELVCHVAIHRDGEARAAAVDASYLPADDRLHPLFLFVTEQWDRYDRADPDGSLLREYCRDDSEHANDIVRAVAARAGRPDPCPPLPPPPPPSEPRRRHHDAIGSWPTSMTGPDSGFGGDGGFSGFTGFGGI